MPSTVNICGLSTAETLHAALAAGADMVGFVFVEKSLRDVSLDRVRTLGEQARGPDRAPPGALSTNQGQ